MSLRVIWVAFMWISLKLKGLIFTAHPSAQALGKSWHCTSHLISTMISVLVNFIHVLRACVYINPQTPPKRERERDRERERERESARARASMRERERETNLRHVFCSCFIRLAHNGVVALQLCAHTFVSRLHKVRIGTHPEMLTEIGCVPASHWILSD